MSLGAKSERRMLHIHLQYCPPLRYKIQFSYEWNNSAIDFDKNFLCLWEISLRGGCYTFIFNIRQNPPFFFKFCIKEDESLWEQSLRGGCYTFTLNIRQNSPFFIKFCIKEDECLLEQSLRGGCCTVHIHLHYCPPLRYKIQFSNEWNNFTIDFFPPNITCFANRIMTQNINSWGEGVNCIIRKRNTTGRRSKLRKKGWQIGKK